MSSNFGKDAYQWVDPKIRYPGAPPYVIGLPEGEGMTPSKIILFDLIAIISALNLILAQVFHIFAFLSQNKVEFKGVADLGLGTILASTSKWDKIKDLFQFFNPWTLLSKPLIADRWQEDIEFGNQFLQGLNPVLIRKCQLEDLKSDGIFPVTDEHLKPRLGENFSLASALEKGK
ncbi:MAG: lipoxygenase, partial [Cyanobacteria bacterium P01_G01_bin.49]